MLIIFPDIGNTVENKKIRDLAEVIFWEGGATHIGTITQMRQLHIEMNAVEYDKRVYGCDR